MKRKNAFESEILNRITSPLSNEDSDNINFKKFLCFYSNKKDSFFCLCKKLNLPALLCLYSPCGLVIR